MIPNTHQSINEIIRAASPAEKILWQQVLLICGERAAVRQLHYQGSYAGSEFVTFATGKLYLCLELDVFPDITPRATNSGISCYDESNAFDFTMANSMGFYNSTTAATVYVANQLKVSNFLFGRLLLSGVAYQSLLFKGYRILY